MLHHYTSRFCVLTLLALPLVEKATAQEVSIALRAATPLTVLGERHHNRDADAGHRSAATLR